MRRELWSRTRSRRRSTEGRTSTFHSILRTKLVGSWKRLLDSMRRRHSVSVSSKSPTMLNSDSRWTRGLALAPALRSTSDCWALLTTSTSRLRWPARSLTSAPKSAYCSPVMAPSVSERGLRGGYGMPCEVPSNGEDRRAVPGAKRMTRNSAISAGHPAAWVVGTTHSLGNRSPIRSYRWSSSAPRVE